jgi:hypothetical protein
MISSADEFARLRTSEDRREYHRAAHDEAPESVWLEVIAKHPDLRGWVACNKTVPISILELLSSDHDVSVRSMVAMKRRLTEKLYRKLAEDHDASVRERIACNAKCPRDILLILTKDPESFVADAARRRLGANAL